MLPAAHEYAALLRRAGFIELGEPRSAVDPKVMEHWRQELVPFEHDLPRAVRELMYHPDLESRDPAVHAAICVAIGDALDDWYWEATGGPYPDRSRG
jgi:hypothetical protein